MVQIIAFLICLSEPGHCEAALLFLPRAGFGGFPIPRLPFRPLLRLPPNLGLLCFRPWSPGFSRRPRSLPPSPGEPGVEERIASPWQPERPSRTPAGGLSLFSAAGAEPEPSARAERPAPPGTSCQGASALSSCCSFAWLVPLHQACLEACG